MNILNLTTRGYSARFFAGITIVSLLLSALPAAFFVANAVVPASTPVVVLAAESTTLDVSNQMFNSSELDASAVNDLVLEFDYDTETADTNDTIEYGWKAGTTGTFNKLGEFKGKNESTQNPNTTDETGSVSISLPIGAQVNNLVIAIFAKNSGLSGDDVVELMDIAVTGTIVVPDLPDFPSLDGVLNSIETAFSNPQGKIQICHYDADSDIFEFKSNGVNLSSILDGNGHASHNSGADVIPPFWHQLDAQDPVLFTGQNWNAEGMSFFAFECPNSPEPIVKGAEYIQVSGDTAAGENQPGWMFNRDLNNTTPIEFNNDEKVIGNGALYVLPISNTDGPRKFIGEYFWQGAIADLDGFSYDFKIGAGGADSDSEEFYLNVYANFGESSPTKYYDCKYDVIPSNGTTASFATAAFDPTQSYTVTTGGSSPHVCPAVPVDMDTLGSGGAIVRAFAINTGDTALNDADLDGYFDNVVLDTKTKVTTFDFEKGAVDPNDENQLTITAIKFHNRNSDNNRDAGEEGLEGWEMRLYKDMGATWGLVATGTTNVSGQKKFPQQKEVGTYYVCEVSQLGWTQVAPAEDTQTVNISPNASEEGAYCTKTVYSDESDRSTKPEIGNVHNDLENQNQLNISGEVYLDIAVDDCDNRSECLFSKTNTKLVDWEMRLYKEVFGIWTEVATSSTNNDGIYRFPTQYEAGVYHTCEVLESGYAQGIGNWNGSGYLVNTANLSGAADEGPYCNTYTYTDASDKSSKSHFGNAKITDYGNITMCKFDEQDNALSGWQLALIGRQVDTLAFAPTAATQSMTNVPVGDYVLKADGAYKYRGGTNLLADARFSERKAGDSGFGTYPNQPWRITNPATGGLSVSVNGDEGASWGNVFSPSHVYYGTFTQNSVSDINFSMYDDAYGDNSGTIDLTLYEGFTGITDENGCVVFEDVPYGNYEVTELMQTGFENTSGLGSVVVDEDEETFTVVNNDLSFIPPCELEVVSDEDTVIIENNDFATSTYVHPNWTASIPGANWIWEVYRVINPEVDTIRTFEETFTVATPTTATLDIGADNSYRVFVNGVLVVDRSTYTNNFQTHTQKTFTTEVLDELVSGENTLRIEVTNNGVSGSNDRSNPAGLLYKLVVNGASNCNVTTDVVTEQSVPATLIITNPAVPGMTLSGTYDFTANYQDADDDEDTVFWAIRADSCGGAHMVGNVPNLTQGSSTFNPVTGEFVATVDMSAWTNGDYCIVVNPREDTGQPDVRATQTFVLDNRSTPQPEPDMYRLDGFKYEAEGEGRSPKAGWTISVSNGVDAPLSTTTDSNGYFYFDVEAGDWTVTEEARTDWSLVQLQQNGDQRPTDVDAPSCEFLIEDEQLESNFRFLSSEAQYHCEFTNQYTQPTTPEETGGETDTPVITRSSGGSSSGQRFSSRISTVGPTPLVLGASTVNVCPFLTEFMQIGDSNNSLQVTYLQLFLNTFKDLFGGTENPVTGRFGVITDTNVKAFQEYYRSEVLDPWYDRGIVPHNRPTGFVYKTTLWKINDIVCPGVVPYPSFEGESLAVNVDNDINEPLQD